MKRALLVGINEYDNVRPLSGCVNDVTAVRPLLARHDDNSPNFECQLLTGPPAKVSRATMLQALRTC